MNFSYYTIYGGIISDENNIIILYKNIFDGVVGFETYPISSLDTTIYEIGLILKNGYYIKEVLFEYINPYYPNAKYNILYIDCDDCYHILEFNDVYYLESYNKDFFKNYTQVYTSQNLDFINEL